MNILLLFFFSVKVNSKIFHPDVRNPKHLALAEFNSWETSGRVGGGLFLCHGAGVPLGASSHLSWSVAGSQLCAAVISKHKDLLPLEELPVSSYIRTKISTSFCLKKMKTQSKEADVKRKKWSVCDWELEKVAFVCLNMKNSFRFCWGRMTSFTVSFQSTQGTKSVTGRQDTLTSIKKSWKQLYRPCALSHNEAMLSNSLQLWEDLECKFKAQKPKVWSNWSLSGDIGMVASDIPGRLAWNKWLATAFGQNMPAFARKSAAVQLPQ